MTNNPEVPVWNEVSRDAIVNGAARVAVLGCGYVGLTVALGLASSGLRVLGVELDETRVKELRAGSNPVPDVYIAPGLLKDFADDGSLLFAPRLEQEADVYIICVNTPLRDGSPDLRFVESAGEMVAAHLKAGALVVLESTTYPGTTEELLRPILEEATGLEAGKDFALAHSPERINPGDKKWGLRNTPKVVGGLTPACTVLASAVYSRVCDKVVEVSSPRAAEITKLYENTYREVNIALANEMSVVCNDFDIDPWEVVAAAASKPFGFTPFYPGPGVGGHCIAIDPQYLAWRVRGKVGRQFRLLETAADINLRMPAHVVQRAAEILNDQGKAIRRAKILLLGMAYKGGSSDTRESPSLRVASRLLASGAEIGYHDAFVDHASVDGFVFESQPLEDSAIAAADLVLILTDHPGIDYGRVVEAASCVFDTRGVTSGISAPPGRLYRA